MKPWCERVIRRSGCRDLVVRGAKCTVEMCVIDGSIENLRAGPLTCSQLRRQTSRSLGDAIAAAAISGSIRCTLYAATSSPTVVPPRGHSAQAMFRFCSMRSLCASRRFRASLSGTVSPRPKYISSGVWPRKALCGIVALCSATQKSISFRIDVPRFIGRGCTESTSMDFPQCYGSRPWKASLQCQGLHPSHRSRLLASSFGKRKSLNPRSRCGRQSA